jgi:hypothetical protein
MKLHDGSLVSAEKQGVVIHCEYHINLFLEYQLHFK